MTTTQQVGVYGFLVLADGAELSCCGKYFTVGESTHQKPIDSLAEFVGSRKVESISDGQACRSAELQSGETAFIVYTGPDTPELVCLTPGEATVAVRALQALWRQGGGT